MPRRTNVYRLRREGAMGKRILVVDDEPDILQTLDTILTAEGFQVASSLDGEEAVERLTSFRPDLLITDMKMPGMSGLEVIKEAKKIDKDLQAIVLTGFGTLDNAIQALGKNGASHYLRKPLDDIEELTLAVDEAIEKRRLQLEIKRKTDELERTNIILGAEIEERKGIEKALRAKKDQNREILDASIDRIWLVDRNMIILWANKKMAEDSHMNRDALIGTPCYRGLLHQNNPCPNCVARRSFDSGEIEHAIQRLPFPGETNEALFREIYAVPMKDRSGQLDHIFISARDITKQMKAENEKKRLDQLLFRSQKMQAIGTLAGGIAHDFNNILMGIQGNASLALFDINPGDPHYECIKNIEEQVKSGAELTKQILGFARKGRYVVEPTDLNILIERVLVMFYRSKKEIDVFKEFQADIWFCEVDRSQIEQVILNLFVNAWQSIPGGGKIYVRTENVTVEEGIAGAFGVKAGRFAKISVTDTGMGMDEETKQRIFEPFFTTKGMGRGTGLGLASAYGIIQNHEGFIEVQSERGHGSTFDTYLPACNQEITVKTNQC